MTHTESCPGCLAQFEIDQSIPMTHPYIGASGACWALYGQILEKEYSDPVYGAVHRITADTYAAQHIGDQSDRRARQSANVHLMALHMMLEKQAPLEDVQTFIRKATEVKQDWPPLTQVQKPQWLTVQDVAQATTPEEHAELVTRWGKSVLDSMKHQLT